MISTGWALRPAALDHLPQRFQQARAVEQPCARIVLVQPVEDLQLLAQRVDADTDDASDEAEESRAIEPVAQVLGLAGDGIERHEGPEQQAGDSPRRYAARRSAGQRRENYGQVHDVQRGKLHAAGGVHEPGNGQA